MEQRIRNDEREINLKDLIYAVLRGWRVILVCAVVFAILLSFYKSSAFSILITDTAAIEEANQKLQKEYQDSLKTYNDDILIYNYTIENQKNSVDAAKTYLDNSILMNISPYAVETAIATYIVTPDEQPSEYYRTNFPLFSLYSMANDSNLVQYLQETCLDSIDEKYIKELITVTSDLNGNTLTIKLIHSDAKVCAAMLTATQEWLKLASAEIADTAGRHTINPVSLTQVSLIDTAINQFQKNVIAILLAAEKDIVVQETALAALVEPVAPAILSATQTSTINYGSLVKYVLLGGIIGAFLSCALIVFLFLTNDKLHTSKELRLQFGLRELNETYGKTYGRFLPAIDKWLNRLFYGKDMMSQEERYKLINARLTSVESSGHTPQKALSLLLIGSATTEEMKTVFDNLVKYSSPTVQYLLGADIHSDQLTVEKAHTADAVILVEKAWDTKMITISNEIDILNDMKKPIAGAIVL